VERARRSSISTHPLYTPRLDDALAFAADAFRYRERKGSGVPYLTHLLQVMVHVAEHGGDEDQMVAALLHDYLEDVAGASETVLRERFGERVSSIVLALSDSTVQPKPPWLERKRAFIARATGMSPDAKLVCAADKLHNARSILFDHERIGDEVFDRFTASKEQTLWYYESVHRALATGWEHRLLTSLEEAVRTLLTLR
jgi:(p)ppGpp synthase/HD superfamily hydrolase